MIQFKITFLCPPRRTNFLRLKSAVTVIQKVWRGYRCRRNYQTVSPSHLYRFSSDEIFLDTFEEMNSFVLMLTRRRTNIAPPVKLLFPSDAVWLPAPSGCLQVKEVLQKLPGDSPSRDSHPSPLPRLPHPADILAPPSCRVDPSGLHQGHDSQTPLPEAQGRGKLSLYLLLLLISCC